MQVPNIPCPVYRVRLDYRYRRAALPKLRMCAPGVK